MANTTYENLPIKLLIKKMTDTKGSPLIYDELKEELTRKDDNNNNIYYLSIKEDNDLCMIYYNNNLLNNTGRDSFIIELENSCRSIILEKFTLRPIVTQFNRILYNSESLEFLKDKNWNHVTVQKCYEGTLIVLFNYNDKWYITTRRCLNADTSSWIRNKSYQEMFNEAMEGKFTYDELNKNYCYHFVLVHYKNKNIVSYNNLGKEYRELFHILTTEKYNLNEIKYIINDKVKYVEEEKFNNIEDLLIELNKQNDLDKNYQKITMEGYVLRYYNGEIHTGPFKTLKLQTNIYESVMKIKPNNSNIYQCFLELYQKNQLNDFLPYFTKYGNEVIKRIHVSMQNLSKETLDLYHLTRKKGNSDLYNELSEQYKKTLYGLHGLYIKNRKQDFDNGTDNKKLGSSRSINVFDVYYYLKQLPSNELRQLFYDRTNMINNSKFNFLNKLCINTMTQCTLMFKNNKNNKNNKN